MTLSRSERQEMLGAEGPRSLLQRIVYFPVTRITVGIVVCGLAMLGTNHLLRLILQSGGDFSRILRWLLSTLAMLAAYHLLFRWYENRKVTELSRRGLILEGRAGFLAGAFCISLIILVLRLLGFYEVLSVGRFSALVLAFFCLIALSVLEEVVFRGILYRIAEESLGTNPALLLSALLFGLAHLWNEHATALSVVSAASGGILVGLLFSLTRRLWLPIFFHAGWNWAQVSLGVAVSGIDELPAFVEGRVEGPALVTGGAFGPENSLLTVLLVLALSGVAYHLALRRGRLIPMGHQST